MAGKNDEEELEYEEPQERDIQEAITEDQTHNLIVNDQEGAALEKALAVQGKRYEEETIVEGFLQQEIMDDEIDGRSMASSTSLAFKVEGKEAQYLVKVDKKLGQFMEHKSSLVSPMPSAIVLTSKSNYSTNRAKQKQKHKYHADEFGLKLQPNEIDQVSQAQKETFNEIQDKNVIPPDGLVPHKEPYALAGNKSLSKQVTIGMEIFSVNLRGTKFNSMIPREKVQACFGFCDIRNFTDATECLQEKVMMFINKIADLIHSKVIMDHGFPNKNIGDAFLIVWKKTISDATSKNLVQSGTSVADHALRSFLDLIHAVETSQAL
eukprot:Gb_01627 [translate_table: standard]